MKKKHSKTSKLLGQLFYFWVFSMGVTVLQYLIFTFLPHLFGQKFAEITFLWPQVPMKILHVSFQWNLLGYEVLTDASGNAIIGGGLGYFLSYEIGTFLAQCINFPLQRNITFKSKGKVSYQIIWYFIAWIVISLICNAFNGLWIPLAQRYFKPSVYNILVTYITGGISMIIYFFVFKIIFPEGKAENKSES
ncbi:MAG: hypothetical protein PHX08_13395 [Lachnospiraceae bacterium]|nr:hypothetical protein [Lachnospiraceae bacterium]